VDIQPLGDADAIARCRHEVVTARMEPGVQHYASIWCGELGLIRLFIMERVRALGGVVVVFESAGCNSRS